MLPRLRIKVTLLATLAISGAGLHGAASAASDGIVVETAATTLERTTTLARVWYAATCDAVPLLEDAESCTADTASWSDQFFRLRAPRGGVDWGVPRPPLQLTGFTTLRDGKPSAGPVDIRIGPGEPLRLAAPKDLCLIDVSARAEVNLAVWQPTFACTPLDATQVRLNADVIYDWKNERVTTPLGFAVAHLFRIGPYEAEVSGALRVQPEVKAYDRTYRAVIRLPFPE